MPRCRVKFGPRYRKSCKKFSQLLILPSCIINLLFSRNAINASTLHKMHHSLHDVSAVESRGSVPSLLGEYIRIDSQSGVLNVWGGENAADKTSNKSTYKYKLT